MRRPIVAHGISAHPSPNRRHVVVRLHDDTDAQAVLALILMDIGCARKVLERLSVALDQVEAAAMAGGVH